MKIHEYQAKSIFAKFAVPVPQGEVATTPAEAQAIVTTADPGLLRDTALASAVRYRVVAGEIERIHG